MSNLLSKDKLDLHIDQFPGLPPERKRQLADHLAALPVDHHKAVRQVLEVPDKDPESHFIRGCFGEEPTPSAPAPGADSAEHPGLPSAA